MRKERNAKKLYQRARSNITVQSLLTEWKGCTVHVAFMLLIKFHSKMNGTYYMSPKKLSWNILDCNLDGKE